MKFVFPYNEEGLLAAQKIRKQFIEENPALGKNIIVGPSNRADAGIYFLAFDFNDNTDPEGTLDGKYIMGASRHYKAPVKEIAIWHMKSIGQGLVITSLESFIKNNRIDFSPYSE